jgi:hypothetical protein
MKYDKRKVSVRHDLGSKADSKGNAKIEVEFEYPVYEDFHEFTQAAGSPEAALEFVNVAVREEAGTRVREFVAESPKTGITESEIVSRAVETGKTFTPIARSSNKDKAKELDQILARVRSEGAQAVQEDLLALAARLQ